MNAELAEAQEELLSVPRAQRATMKRRVHRLDIVCRQMAETHSRLRANQAIAAPP